MDNPRTMSNPLDQHQHKKDLDSLKGYCIAFLICLPIWFLIIFGIIKVSEGAEIGLNRLERGQIWTISEERRIIRCIVGESALEGYEGMVAIGEAIRNRAKIRIDPLDGVYGCNAKHLDDYGEDHWIWWKGEQAWKDSEFSNLVKGADHWHSTLEPSVWWEKYGELTAIVGFHKFYKNVVRRYKLT